MFATSAVVTLAIGIAVNTIVFTLLNSVALRPMPVPNPDRLVRMYPIDARGHRENLFSYPDYLDYKAASLFDDVTAYIPSSVTARVGASEAEDLIAYIVAPNYFTLLGIEPSQGRMFVPADEQGADPAIAVISHSFWRRRFASDPAIIGSSLVINNRRFTIVGVGPSRFSGTEPLSPDVWVTVAVQRTVLPPDDLLTDRSSSWLLVIGRLKPTVSKSTAATALSGTAARLAEAYPGRNRPSAVAIAAGSFFTLDAGIWPVIILVLSTVALVLAIACANVGNLVLARTTGRQREIAVRLAIGASRWRIVRHLMAESVLISLAGGALGLLMATWALDVLYPLGLSFVPAELGSVVLDLSPDLRVFAYTFCLASAAGLLLGLAPALQSSSPRLASSLHDDGAMIGIGLRPARLRSALVVLQVSVCLVLLVGAGLLARGLQRAQSLDVGFRTAGVIFTEYDLRRHGYTPNSSCVYLCSSVALKQCSSVVSDSVSMGSRHRTGGARAGHGLPRPDAPARHEPIAHIWVARGEGLGNGRRVPAEQQDGAIDRILECAAKDELSARVGRPRQREMLVPERGATFDVVRDDVVKEQVVHGG